MAAEIFTIVSEALPLSTKVIAWSGTEAISRPYLYELHLTIPHGESLDFDLDSAVGRRATLLVNTEDGLPRQHVHGVLSSIEIVADLSWHGLYRAVLVPELWQLALSRHSRVFTGESVPDILKKVLGASSIDHDLKLVRSYAPLEHVCQYQESDLDFISRWMEREGMYYFFEQGADRETLVITDARSMHSRLGSGPTRYFPTGAGDTSTVEAFRAFRCRHGRLPTDVKLKDYDYIKPRLDVSGAAPVVTDAPKGPGVISVHGEGFLTPDDGKRLAGVRAEEMLARRVVFQGEGRVFDLRAGYLFELEDHPRPAFNDEYLTIELLQRGSNFAGAPDLKRVLGGDDDEGDATFRASVVAIPSRTQFRAERQTPTPRIYGLESATVDGPATSEYAQIDAHGRYKLKIRFDESDLSGGKASTWIRMLQPHGGSPEGFHFPLRKDTEVLLAFLGGDPDRPVIVGVGPTSLTPSPVTEQNHSQNVIMTGGENRIELEDAAGGQYIDTSSPPQNTFTHLGAHHGPHAHNWIVSTDGNGLVHTGGDRNITVGGVQTEDVQGDLTEDYHANQTTHVFASFKETVDGNAEQMIQGTSKQTITGSHTQTVNGGETRTVNAGAKETISGGLTQTINGGSTETINGSLTQSITGGATISTPAAYTISAQGGLTINAPAGTKIVAQAGHTVIAPGGHTNVDDFFAGFGKRWDENYHVKMSMVLFKLDIVTSLAMSLYGNKIDIGLQKLDVCGNKMTVTGGAEIKQTMTEIKSGAFHLGKFGFTMWG